MNPLELLKEDDRKYIVLTEDEYAQIVKSADIIKKAQYRNDPFSVTIDNRQGSIGQLNVKSQVANGAETEGKGEDGKRGA